MPIISHFDNLDFHNNYGRWILFLYGVSILILIDEKHKNTVNKNETLPKCDANFE